MLHRKLVLTIAGMALALGITRADAEITASAEVYRLQQGSTFQQGCFPPCLCPIEQEASVRGTFAVRSTGFDGLFNTYAITDVNWTVSVGNLEFRITGSGTYQVGGEFALLHRLKLDLQVGDGPLQHFDGGLVPGGSGFPNIEITVSINRQRCFDRVIVLKAAPVPPDEIHDYVLAPQTTLEIGCFDPCLCPIVRRPVVGTFSLVPISHSSWFPEWAVVNVEWQALDQDPSTGPPSLGIKGFGTYRFGGEFALEHQLSLDLSFDSVGLAHVDSDLVIGGSNFPAIDIGISMNGRVCADQVFDIHAVPRDE